MWNTNLQNLNLIYFSVNVMNAVHTQSHQPRIPHKPVPNYEWINKHKLYSICQYVTYLVGSVPLIHRLILKKQLLRFKWIDLSHVCSIKHLLTNIGKIIWLFKGHLIFTNHRWVTCSVYIWTLKGEVQTLHKCCGSYNIYQPISHEAPWALSFPWTVVRKDLGYCLLKENDQFGSVSVCTHLMKTYRLM